MALSARMMRGRLFPQLLHLRHLPLQSSAPRFVHVDSTRRASGKEFFFFTPLFFTKPAESSPSPTSASVAPSSPPSQPSIDPLPSISSPEPSAVTSVVTNASTVDPIAPIAHEPNIFIFPYDYIISSLHSHLGMPWWLSLVTLTVATRFMVLPFTIRALKVIPTVSPTASKESMFSKSARRQEMEEYRKSTANMTAQLIPTYISAVFTLFLFFASKNLAWYHPEALNESLLWLPSIGQGDPYYLLPTLTGALIILNMENTPGVKIESTVMKQTIRVVIMGVSILLSSFPSSLFLFLSTQYLFDVVALILLRRTSLGRLFKIPLKATPARAKPTTPIHRTRSGPPPAPSTAAPSQPSVIVTPNPKAAKPATYFPRAPKRSYFG